MLKMQVSIPGAKKVHDRTWEAALPPSDVRRLHDTSTSVGATSVLIFSRAPELNAGILTFSLDDVAVVNIGSTDRTILIDGTGPTSFLDRLKQGKSETAKFAPGDQEFINRLDNLPEGVRTAGRRLLIEARSHFPGELKPLSGNRFQETPDNFWFVRAQPRAESILIVVRGMPSRFQPSSLEILEDRRPYSRFKVRSVSEVPEAIRILRTAIRRAK